MDTDSLTAAKQSLDDAIGEMVRVLELDGICAGWLLGVEVSSIDADTPRFTTNLYAWLASTGASYRSNIGMVQVLDEIVREQPAADYPDDPRDDDE